jgi:uncharacterized delta-60 repeat protein
MTRTHRLRAEPLEDRLAPTAGQLDPAFGSGGVASLTAVSAPTLAALPDGGAAVVFYTSTDTSPPTVKVERLRPDGTPDPNFGAGGVTSLPLSPPVDNYSYAITAQPDGRVVVAYDALVVRLTTAGALDPTFGTNGVVTLGYPHDGRSGQYPVSSAVHVLPDGTISVAGSAALGVAGPNGFPRTSMLVNRLTAGGQPDPAFGPGYAVADFPLNDLNTATAADVAYTPDGKLVLVGKALVGFGSIVEMHVTEKVPEYAGAVVRLNPDGSPDTTFGTNGRLLDPLAAGLGNGLTAVRVLSTGPYLVAGTGGGGGVTGRVNPDGSLDAAYGTGGVGKVAAATNPAILPDGRVAFSANSLSPAIVRVTQGGQVDTRFGTNGQADVSGTGLVTGANAIVADPAGRLLLVGSTAVTGGSNTALVIRLLGDAPPAGFVPAAVGTVQAGGPADGTVGVLTPAVGTYAVTGRMAVFPGFTGVVRTATADVNGDGTPDYIDAAGPGGQPAVVVFDGKTGAVLTDFLAFEPTFTGGVFVAAGDLDGDGRAEVVVSPDQGGGPRVEVFAVAGDAVTLRANFYGIDDPNFRGGARVAVGDFDHDGTPDLAVAAGFLGGPRVAIFGGTSLFTGTPTKLVNDFFAFTGSDVNTLRNGVFVAAGDVDGDGFADLLAGGGPGGGPRVLTISGKVLTSAGVGAAQAAPLMNFFVAGNAADRGGVRLAVTDADGDNRADVLAGSGEGSPSRARIYLGKDITSPAEPATFQDLDPFGAVPPGGVFVG